MSLLKPCDARQKGIYTFVLLHSNRLLRHMARNPRQSHSRDDRAQRELIMTRDKLFAVAVLLAALGSHAQDLQKAQLDHSFDESAKPPLAEVLDTVGQAVENVFCQVTKDCGDSPAISVVKLKYARMKRRHSDPLH